LNSVEIILKNKVKSVTFPLFFMVELQNFLNAPRTWPHDSFQVIRLPMTFCIFQGHWTVSHQISQKRCVIWQKLLYILIGATFDDLEVHLKVISA